MSTVKEIIDLDVFLQGLDNDEDLLQEILGYYLDDSGRIITELKQSISDGNTAETRRLAHTLKGTSANVHASKLRDAAFNLETAISNNALADQNLLLEKIEQCRNELLPYLRSALVNN